MTCYGVDFTSAPSRRKPINGCRARLDGDQLVIEEAFRWTNFDHWVAHFAADEPYIAALDFPFGMPRRFIQSVGWPTSWSDYVELVRPLGRAGFAKVVRSHSAQHEPGDKYYPRAADSQTGACSPMMVDYTPVGRMFAEAAPRIASLEADIVPCRRLSSNKVLVEGYPGVVARRITREPYKSEDRRRDPERRRQSRLAIVSALTSNALANIYGVRIDVASLKPDDLINDFTGDSLDAVLCALQAAWAYRSGFLDRVLGDPNEGWIADPMVS